MKKLVFFIACIFILNKAEAQQDPQYTHYMYNMNVVNPAYATAAPSILNFGGLYRTQWVGAVGAPKTFTFFAHTPASDRIELGLSMVSDDIGDGAKKENNIYADFAYILQLNASHRLSLGIKAGVTLFETNFNGFELESGAASTDPAFRQNINSTFPNIGAGAFYFTDQYYLGLSAPNLLSTKHLEEADGISRFGSENIHVFFTGGFVFQLNKNLKLKPSFMAKAVAGAPAVADFSANALLYDKLEFGVSYRLGDAVSGLANFRVMPNLRIGYAYDYTVTNLGNFNSGTHEVFLLFDLNLMKKGYDKSPRFF
ncbi:MAG TPA: type IX secretion system membrane protein PorP/SprF [Flavobacterium sp.]|nr:type IX secretion system membrane protein PorP/SprF [Flavobacterium sp.]